ncbi:MAG: hypothetical protein JNL24_15125 [Bacteroidia bacterium]|nr:hypothetical protein [Bacteroidia bacterium]
MEKNTIQPIAIRSRLTSISLDKFSVLELDKEQMELINVRTFAFEFNISLVFLDEQKSVKLICSIKIFNSEQKELFLGEIDSHAIFEIENFSEITPIKSQATNVIIGVLGGTLLSTTRGFLYLKAEGTIIEGALLPIINLSAISAAQPIDKPISDKKN